MLYPIELRVRFEVLEYGEGPERNQAINWIDSNKPSVPNGEMASPSSNRFPNRTSHLIQQPDYDQEESSSALGENILFLQSFSRLTSTTGWSLECRKSNDVRYGRTSEDLPSARPNQPVGLAGQAKRPGWVVGFCSD